eukprot:1160265-Pelagomonas_calceolata.AAC.9
MSAKLRTHPVLLGECLGGALYINDFIRLARQVSLRQGTTGTFVTKLQQVTSWQGTAGALITGEQLRATGEYRIRTEILIVIVNLTMAEDRTLQLESLPYTALLILCILLRNTGGLHGPHCMISKDTRP